MLVLLLLVLLFAASAGQPAPSGPEPDPPTWADKLEAWSTLGAAFVALAAAVATIWLLVHQIRETKRARQDASNERAEAATDRELARHDRELATSERRDAERTQARTMVIGETKYDFGRSTPGGFFIGKLSTSVTNYSSQPILSVQLVIDCDQGSRDEWPVEFKRIGVLGPGESLRFAGYGHEMPNIEEADVEEAQARLSISAYFTDASGRRWHRREAEQPMSTTD